MLKKILVAISLTFILSCSKSNPTRTISNQVSIFLSYNNTDARGTSCYIYEDNKINHIIPVSTAYDTLTAANGSTLRAEYSVSGYATVNATVAKDQLYWVISTGK
jgi:ABC-type branched-subunit amino acid transport system substrate-binding protein